MRFDEDRLPRSTAPTNLERPEYRDQDDRDRENDYREDRADLDEIHEFIAAGRVDEDTCRFEGSDE